MKFMYSLLFAALFAAMSTASYAQLQTYTVCNNDTTSFASVCLQIDCGGSGGYIVMAPCPVLLPPRGCYSWTFPISCIPAFIDVNGVPYAVLPPGGCVPLAPPNPPNQLCFYPWGAALDY